MNISGCTLKKLEKQEAEAFFSWVSGASNEKPNSPDNPDLQYLLAHSVSGVTWGYWDGAKNSWCTSDRAFSDLSPVLEEKSLLELRIFGETAEVHLWNTENGLAGRIVSDQHDHTTEYLKPADIELLLEGEPGFAENNGFTRVRGQTGKEQALPREFNTHETPSVLLARQYFEQDESTGVVRPVLTRLKGFRMR